MPRCPRICQLGRLKELAIRVVRHVFSSTLLSFAFLNTIQMIVRKFTNYLHQVYLKSHPNESSPSAIMKNNPLLKFSTILTGRQMFARDAHDTVMAAVRQRVRDTGANEVAMYQTVLKEMWDSFSSEQKSEWDAKADDEPGDIAVYVFRIYY